MAGALPVPPVPDVEAIASDCRIGDVVPLEWHFPGHGTARPGLCGCLTKVGHRRASTGRLCLWDEIYRCRCSSCPECFDKPGGYATSEAKTIADRLEKYFDLRNLALIRGLERRRSAKLEARATDLCRAPSTEHAAVGDGALGRTRLIRWLRAEATRARGKAHVRKPVHVVVAPPPERWGEIFDVDGYRALRAEATEQARARGVDGAVAVFHNKRLRSSRWEGNASIFEPDELDVPTDGPHWHMIGDGWVSPRGPLHERAASLESEYHDRARSLLERIRWSGTEPVHRATRHAWAWRLRYSLGPVYGLGHTTLAAARHEARSEWFVSNLGVRVSVFQTAFYVLTHAGFAARSTPVQDESDGSTASDPSPKMSRVETSYPRGRSPVETVTWWGDCSARSFPMSPESTDVRICAHCGDSLSPGEVGPFAYLPTGPPPEGDVEGDPAEWRAVGLIEHLGRPPRSRYELSQRLAENLRKGAWKFRRPSGLERWEIEEATRQADDAYAVMVEDSLGTGDRSGTLRVGVDGRITSTGRRPADARFLGKRRARSTAAAAAPRRGRPF
jgi:hypothetical protein